MPKKPVWPYRIKKGHPLTKGLVGAWIFDNVGGEAIWIDLINGNHGVTVGSTISHAQSNDGIGVNFSGDNNSDRIDLGSISPSNPLSCSDTGIVSIATKLSYDSSVGNLYPRIFDKSNASFAAGGYALTVDKPSGKLVFYVSGLDSSGLFSTSPLTSDPTSVIGVITGSEFKYYINGALDRSVAAARTIPSTTTNAAIGNWNHSTDRNIKGGKEYLYVYNEEKVETEARILNDDPYLFIEEIRTSANDDIYAALFPVTTTNTYTHIASGGVTTGGSATVTKINSHVASGGINTGGSANITKSKVHQASGGISTSGQANVIQIKNYLSSGGITTGGSANIAKTKAHQANGGISTGGQANVIQIKNYLPAGGITTGGAAATSKVSAGTNTYTHVASGGVITGGSAQVINIKNYQTSGGVNTGGAASVSTAKVHQANGGVSTGGLADVVQIKNYLPTGGITTGGAANIAKIKSYIAAGGIITGGSATMWSSTSVVINMDNITMSLINDDYDMELSDDYGYKMELS